ncbi:MAG TPA: hypothetical protein VHN15_13755 [Thermoanaerobaculia bacterium]|nr:hypothetical protein [Thermoanaerobaculia bacterium]
MQGTLRRYVPILALLALGTSLPSAAQAPQDSFSDTLDVQAVDIEVLVTDRRGNPVPGLKATDFKLLVEGKEVPVEYFAEINDGTAVTAPPAQAGGRAVPAPPLLDQSNQVANNYLVFIDEFFTPPAMRNEALRGLAREAMTLRPQDRMAIVSYDGRKLTILSPWIGPGEPLQKFLAQLGEHKASLAASPFSIRDLEPAADTLIEAYGNQLDRASRGGTFLDQGLNEKREAVYVDRSIEAAVAPCAASPRSPGASSWSSSRRAGTTRSTSRGKAPPGASSGCNR